MRVTPHMWKMWHSLLGVWDMCDMFVIYMEAMYCTRCVILQMPPPGAVMAPQHHTQKQKKTTPAGCQALGLAVGLGLLYKVWLPCDPLNCWGLLCLKNYMRGLHTQKVMCRWLFKAPVFCIGQGYSPAAIISDITLCLHALRGWCGFVSTGCVLKHDTLSYLFHPWTGMWMVVPFAHTHIARKSLYPVPLIQTLIHVQCYWSSHPPH